VAELFGMSVGALLIIACIRETLFVTDLTRMSWVKGGFASIPFIFFVRGVGGAENGVYDTVGASVQAGIALTIALVFFAVAKKNADLPYERKQRLFTKILSWLVMLLFTAGAVLKLLTGMD
jgi:hypothetical protein